MLKLRLYLYGIYIVERLLICLRRIERFYKNHTTISPHTKYNERVDIIQFDWNNTIVLRINNTVHQVASIDVDPIQYGATYHPGTIAIQELMKESRESL